MLALIGRNGIDVSSVARERNMRTTAASQIDHALHQIMGTLRAFCLDHGFEGIEPLLRFNNVGIVGGLRQDLIDLG